MTEKVPTKAELLKAQRLLLSKLDVVINDGETVKITEGDKTVAVLMPYTEYAQMKESLESRSF